MENNKGSFSLWIKKQRALMNMKQKDFAQYLEIGYQTLKAYELGYSYPSPNNVSKIALKLNSKPEYLARLIYNDRKK